ncbi:MAG: M3 family metallopeptidase [Bacteroidales bacterium]|nr:M3 family metallopeptidase [Candidatus Cacconaster equifaecalis]
MLRKITAVAALSAAILTNSCTMTENPLLTPSSNPYGAPAFDKIKDSDYKPAFETAIASAKKEIEAIVNNPEAPTFENTIEALEYCGKDLGNVENIFFNLNEACTNPTMQAVAEEVSPMLTEYSMSVILNAELFGRIKTVWEQKDKLNLNTEQSKLLKETYESFARNGANLPDDKKAEFSKVSEELSLATLKFGKNVLASTNAFTLNLTDEADLAGLPEYVKEMAASEAKGRGEQGWTFTLNAPSYGPFLKFSERRDLREKMWKAYNMRNINDEFDNTQEILNIVGLRIRSSQLLGYRTYAEAALVNKMAKTPETVNSFLDNLMSQTLEAARKEVDQIRQYAVTNGFKGTLMPWDFSFWSEKYKDATYSLNEELLKPYFKLENVIAAIFDLANRLYGLQFKENAAIPVYHPDVKAFEVSDEGGRFMALLYMDFFPRESKRGGAWMTEFRGQSIKNGVEERPFVSLVTNFTKPTETTPSLLTFDEVTTILHEFGHALHGMLAEGSYGSLTGTSVARDFVELPSQIMENWAYEPEYLKTFAKHYQTGEVIPQEYIDRIVAAKNFLAGYSQVRQLQFGQIDMAWHCGETVPSQDVVAYEQSVVSKSAVVPIVEGAAMGPQFNHIFSGGYSAGYYSYKWAEVLEADAFELFKEKGIFSREVSDSFRKNILSRGSIEDADVLYRNFRGRDPESDALLKKYGLK